MDSTGWGGGGGGGARHADHPDLHGMPRAIYPATHLERPALNKMGPALKRNANEDQAALPHPARWPHATGMPATKEPWNNEPRNGNRPQSHGPTGQPASAQRNAHANAAWMPG